MDTPPAPPRPTPKGVANTLKNPRTLIIVGVLAVAFALYFRSRPRGTDPSLAVPDGTGDPVGYYDDGYYPGVTQGAGGGVSPTGVDTTGQFYGYNEPPDWLTEIPSWLTAPPAWYNTEPPATNAANPAAPTITLSPGQSAYNPETGQLVTAPNATVTPTGGGPPSTGTPGNAQKKPNTGSKYSGIPTHTVNAKEKVGERYIMGYGPNKNDEYTVVKRNGKLFRDYGKGRLLKI